MDLAYLIIQILVLVLLFGILTAVKSGFNEVIRGLEELHSSRP